MLYVYVIDLHKYTDYLLLCSGTGGMYCQEIDIGFGMQERKLVEI